MSTQLSIFAAPTQEPPPPPEPRYGWGWKACPLLRETRGKQCEPREGVRVQIDFERIIDGGRLDETYFWIVMGCGALQSGEALTFEGAEDAARKAVEA